MKAINNKGLSFDPWGTPDNARNKILSEFDFLHYRVNSWEWFNKVKRELTMVISINTKVI